MAALEERVTEIIVDQLGISAEEVVPEASHIDRSVWLLTVSE